MAIVHIFKSLSFSLSFSGGIGKALQISIHAIDLYYNASLGLEPQNMYLKLFKLPYSKTSWIAILYNVCMYVCTMFYQASIESCAC